VLLKTDFHYFPTDALTFEAWVSSSDFCSAGTLMSYAKQSTSTAMESQRRADYNHFVIFDTRNVLACHDFEYLDLYPDPEMISCHASLGSGETASLVERTGSWHHVAVTWSAGDEGMMRIYKDGLLMVESRTGKTATLDPHGALMLGGEQDCFGGCTDPGQGFNGLLDEVRIWRVARSQEEILKSMRLASGLEGNSDLVAWWKFDDADADNGQFQLHTVARDSSSYGNHLALQSPPTPQEAVLKPPGSAPVLQSTALSFRNNHAINDEMTTMPEGSFSVELWARGSALKASAATNARETLFSYATQQLDADTRVPVGFLDDAVRLERLQADLSTALLEPFWETSTAGALRLHVNSNAHSDDGTREAWIDFHAGWTHDEWVHIAVTWDARSGRASCFVDGEPVTPFWRTEGFVSEQVPPSDSGVEPYLSAGTLRAPGGSLVLGEDQDCWGGCFRASHAFRGQLAAVRVWSRALPRDEVLASIGKERPAADDGLCEFYSFSAASLRPMAGGGTLVTDGSGHGQHLALRSRPPQMVYSTAPLAHADGRPLRQPAPGAAGYSLALSDQQVLLAPNFTDFPATAITLEFWMWSTDVCRAGVPVSYAVGDYGTLDNAFLLFNYNDFGVAVMEDEGTLKDHTSGVAVTDGLWHHMAVTWQSKTGEVVLYDNARPVWRVVRAKGAAIPSGGTLVVGREQDCLGGCFDSAPGAAGRLDGQGPLDRLVYAAAGAQDFVGVVDEMRLWRVVRTPEEIRAAMGADDGRAPRGFASPGVDPHHPDLVAYWRFDDGPGATQARDATGHGHHLHAASTPVDWRVTPWLSTCGNGLVEGTEECDDGGRGRGGCSEHCRITPGWECHGSPSECVQKRPKPGSPGGSGGPIGPGGGSSGGSSGGGSGSGSESGDKPPWHPPGASDDEAAGGGSGAGAEAHSQWTLLAWVAVLAAVAVGVSTVAFVKRHELCNAAPAVCASVASLAGRLGMRRSRGGGGGGAHALDPEMSRLLAPDFVASSPVGAAPGLSGPYHSLPSHPPYPRPSVQPADPLAQYLRGSQ